MKKSARKLSLTRETVIGLQEVGGGGYPTTTQAISFCICPTQNLACSWGCGPTFYTCTTP